MEQGNVTVETTQHQDFDAPIESQGTAQEKLITQSHANALINRAVARERTRQGESVQTIAPDLILSQLSEDVIKKIAQEAIKQIAPETIQNSLQELAQKHQEVLHEQNMQQIVNEFAQKIESEKNKYPDFDELLKDADYEKLAQVVEFINPVDNAVDVTYELLTNPFKLEQLAFSAQMSKKSRQLPKNVKNEITKMSHVLKQNQQSESAKTVREPLSQLKPSRGLDNGSMTTADYRKLPAFRR